MHIVLLHNRDHTALDDDPALEAREDVVRVAASLAEALEGPTREVELVALNRDLGPLHAALSRAAPDVVVNLCESLAADSRGELLVPAMLEVSRVAYTGSSALSLALALHKHKAKEVLQARGVPTPAFQLVSHVEEVVGITLPFPLIVKPSREDASSGIDLESVVHDRAALGRAVSRVLRTFKQPALVEQYIDGREIYVPLLGNSPRRALPLTEIRFGAAFDHQPHVLTYRAKWDLPSAESIDSPSVPAQLTPELEARCIEVALAAFEALECRDYGRVDLRVDASGTPYVIDINPNCDLHPQAGFARAAAAAGIGYADLALHLVELAVERRHGNSAPRTAGPAAARRAAQPHRDLQPGRGAMRARAHRRRAPARQP